MERDLFGGQRKIWETVRNRKQRVNQYVETQKIIEFWIKYYEYRKDEKKT